MKTLENTSKGSTERSKVLRLLEYLTRIASLRTKITRDINDYQNVLWIKDIPRLKGCFTQAWGRNEDYDPEVWIEIQTRREPPLPSVPPPCKEWINKSTLRNKNDLPELLAEITQLVKSPSWFEGSEQPELIPQVELLTNHSEIQKTWDKYIEEAWLPWTETHTDWERIQEVYSKLFAIHQEQLRLGEEYELVLALGLLTWKTPSSQRVCRHLVVANAVLEFEARLGKFTVRPMPDGANIRPELDMLDIEEQPAHAEETAKASLINAGDDPWDRSCLDGVLEALVHLISAQGEYSNTLDNKTSRTIPEKPIVEFAPALVLRKRSGRGLTETLKRIKNRIESGGYIPSELADLAEIKTKTDGDLDNGRDEKDYTFEGEIFFPRPSNEEQRRIVHKIRSSSGLLVQGPPGTGKSHTIANLICHLLATGRRTLITTKTPRALQVLEKLMPEELRPLCINLLGNGLEEKRSLESSIHGMLRKNEEWNESQAAKERENLEIKLRRLREEKAQVDRRLLSIRESETHSHSIGENSYCGTAARIAEGVNRDKSTYEWLTDTVPIDKQCPTSENELRAILVILRQATPENRKKLELALPDNPPTPETISGLFESERIAGEEENQAAQGADQKLSDHLSIINSDKIQAIHDSLVIFENERRQTSALPATWIEDCLKDVLTGNSSVWSELHRATLHAISTIQPIVNIADEANVQILRETDPRVLLEDISVLKQHLVNGGKLGWGPFRAKPVKERIYALRAVTLNGRTCSSLDHLKILTDALRCRVVCEKAWAFWPDRREKLQGPYALQLQALKTNCDNLAKVLSLEECLKQCRQNLAQHRQLGEPIWANGTHIEQWISSCELALAHRKNCQINEEIQRTEASLLVLVTKNDAHPVVKKLLHAIQTRNVQEYSGGWNEIQELETERLRLKKLDEELKKLRQHLPKLTEELEQTCNDPCWDLRISQIQNAWYWAQARHWIEEYLRKDDAPSLDIRARQIENEINSTIAGLASLYAWSFCFSRLKENHRRHMAAWQQSMRHLGKGTGKHAPRHRREAQQHLNECRDAVPAWVMPLHRVWDTVDPLPGIFDVIIVDEASQCGIEALPLFYLGEKILIVGDDKQISPDPVGLPRDAMHRLMEEFLYDFQFQSSFDIEGSLFDHGKIRYGQSQITLQEHFRCMPEIIRFSNDLCYSDTPLVPLRQYGPDRLSPIEHVFVNGGYREGSNNYVINRPEAQAIVDKIVELCADHKYDGKTMGVVVLQGEAQASLIEEMLLKRIGAEEMERRRLVCGNPYSFQGDERHVIFLSMVAATNERIGSFTKSADERRFNVAASRAQDQMFLFHSVRNEDLSSACLRKRLLEFFENRKPQQIPGIDQEELARRASRDNRSVIRPPTPFESWFEVDVALELLKEGYWVFPQYEISGKRIDLVVEGGQARLAVECDGDKWHGLDRYEADMYRQRQLERCGWEFFRVRESAFYADKELALQGLWRVLEERGIYPGMGSNHGSKENKDESIDEEYEADEVMDEEENDAEISSSENSQEGEERQSGLRPEEVRTLQIQQAGIGRQ